MFSIDVPGVGPFEIESLGCGAYLIKNQWIGYLDGGVMDDFGTVVPVNTQQMGVSLS